ncbi:hypothetical protein ACFSCW_03485 [Sphingomonas tabacisoli]|uniref:Uncharacterized protein n=1 Tax=Sphingomonas tabacisoli TaxID=2249466 RepID=A0ABW4I0X8_9SPHN
MTHRTRQLLDVLALIGFASAPMGAILAGHAYASTQPRTCEDKPDFIIQTGEPVTVRRCYAWGWWQVSEAILHNRN